MECPKCKLKMIKWEERVYYCVHCGHVEKIETVGLGSLHI